MNKIIIFGIIFFLFTSGIVFAKSNKGNTPVIKFNGAKYFLMYSAKSSETGGYLNEYYKTNQTYASWNELIGVHHYPTAYYPIEHAKEFARYLNEAGIISSIEIDDENNTALLNFIITDKHKLPIIMEFNVFKYVKSPICGTVALQYAKRYRLNNPLEAGKVRKDILKNGYKYLKKVNKLQIPDVISVEIDNGKYLLKEGCNDSLEHLD